MSDWSSDVCSSDLDLLTFSQACEDLGVVHGLLARLHFSRLITALVEREHDERSLAGSNQRLRWPEQRGLRTDRKSVVEGTRVAVRVDLGGRRILKKQKHLNDTHN